MDNCQTLDAFISEAGLPPDAGTMAKNSFTIEKLLEEKKSFDLSVQFEKLGTDEDGTNTGWKARGRCSGQMSHLC